MRQEFLIDLGRSLRETRQRRRLTQPQLAQRLGRSASRISELESDLLHGRAGRDRLGLLAEACDALGLALVLAPRERLQAVQTAAAGAAPRSSSTVAVGSAFDDLFVDLSDGDDVEDDG